MGAAKFSLGLFLAATCALTLSGCADLGDPYYSPPPSSSYGGGYYGDPYYRDDYYRDRERDRIRREQRELDRERDRIEAERRRLEEERNNEYNRPPPPQRIERCPSGFTPSEQKCTPEERRRGCRDMRLPGGLGCVSR